MSFRVALSEHKESISESSLVDQTKPARSDDDDDIIARQRVEIEELKHQLTGQTPLMVSHNVINESKFDSLQKTYMTVSRKAETSDVKTGYYQSDNLCCKSIPSRKATTPRSSQTVAGSMKVSPKTETSPSLAAGSMKVKPKTETSHSLAAGTHSISPKESSRAGKVVLVDGYDVYLCKRQLDEIDSSSGGRATKLFSSLLGVFFEPHILAQSSALGTRNGNPLDKEVLNACMAFTQAKQAVAWSVLIDAAHDKCAQTRRKRKTGSV